MKRALVLLHGLGSHPQTLRLLAYWLKKGYDYVECVSYPVDELEIPEMVAFIDGHLSKKLNKEEYQLTLIGQSMGGVVANHIHRSGWKVEKAVYIGAPLKGARLLNQLESVLPTLVRNLFYKKPYGILQTKEEEQPPPHPYRTISMGWLWTTFDGCVYQDEAVLEEKHHMHLPCADHRTIFANPRLCMRVAELLESM